MDYEEINWRINDKNLVIGLNRQGSGPVVLMLPAMSSFSSRREMQPLQDQLAGNFETISVDWPGFGDLSKPYIDWRPELYLEFIDFLLKEKVKQPYAIISAGHACSYLIKYFENRNLYEKRLVFLSPTWRGPLPTMMNGHHAFLNSIKKYFDIPYLGAILYGLNVNRLVVGMMARGHVYSDGKWLKGRRMREKLSVTKSKGARHSSVRFVTGCLDPFHSRDAQINCARKITSPVLNMFSNTAPRKSRQDMEEISGIPNFTTVRISCGKLSFYEEFPEPTAKEINRFFNLGQATSGDNAYYR